LEEKSRRQPQLNVEEDHAQRRRHVEMVDLAQLRRLVEMVDHAQLRRLVQVVDHALLRKLVQLVELAQQKLPAVKLKLESKRW
jgi:hypothetical protein